MNKFIVVLGCLILSACASDGTQSTQTVNAEKVACEVDAIAVPLAEVGATAATVTNPGAAVANQAAQAADAPVHATIQKDCVLLNAPNN